ncbi:hypothetical protein FPV67DRAFT_869987 [Lyophyllum atratum]|nr:hypothetical protein FPV67DRAFT_869987 [Lyophyllum atratum]
MRTAILFSLLSVFALVARSAPIPHSTELIMARYDTTIEDIAFRSIEERAAKKPAGVPATKAPSSGGKGGACPIRSPGKKSGNVKRANIEIPPFITIKKTKFTLSKVKTSGTSAVAKASGGLKPAFAKASDDDAELEKEFKNTQTVFAKHPDVVPQAIAFDLDETTTPCPAGGARKWLIIDQAKGKLLQDTAKYMAAKPEAQADLKDAAAKLMMAKAKEIAKDGLKHPDLNGKNIFFDDQITKVTGIIDWADAAKGSPRRRPRPWANSSSPFNSRSLPAYYYARVTQ